MTFESLSVVFVICIYNFQNNYSADQHDIISADLILMFTPETDTETLCPALQYIFACRRQKFDHQRDMNPLVFPLEANHLDIALASNISQLKLFHFHQAWVEKLLSQKAYSQYLYMLHPHLLVYDLNKIYIYSVNKIANMSDTNRL